MNEHLQTWHADHRNYRALLHLLEVQLDHFRNAGEPDYEVMLDILHYMSEGPDQLHHVHEDIAYAALAERLPTFKPIVVKLQEQHQKIIESGLKLLSDLGAIVGGNMVTRDHIDIQAKAYVAYLREHLVTEERKLFPALEENQDCFKPLPGVSPDKDPVFGGRAGERYRGIRQLLTEVTGNTPTP